MPAQHRTATDDELELHAHAARAAARAHAPYSSYPVGAAVEVAGGDIIVGCNVENASFGLTMCAERVALGAAIAAGHAGNVERIAVHVATDDGPPCGACRQVMLELAPEATVTYLRAGRVVTTTTGALLPDAFDSRALNR